MDMALFIEYFTIFWFWVGVMVNLAIVLFVADKIYTIIRVKVKRHKNKKYVNDYRISHGNWNDIRRPPTIPNATKDYLNDPDYYGD